MPSPRAELAPDETNLTEQWRITGNRALEDATTERIDWLTRERLQALGTTSDGWEQLFRDPRDGRLWELTYPFSEMHGGGPRQLRLITPTEARSKYHVAAV